MFFRDESERVSTKYKRIADAKSKRAAEQDGRSSRSASEELVERAKQRKITATKPKSSSDAVEAIRSLCQSVQETSNTWFLGTFIQGSRFAYLPDLHRNHTSSNVLSAVVDAASLASLSIETNRAELMFAARQSYTEAIAGINGALQASSSVDCTDELLAAILLLAFFESLTFEGETSLSYWNAHINGAMCLVGLRGTELLNSRLGLELFVQLGCHIRLHCVQERLRIPPRLLELADVAHQYLEPSDPLRSSWLGSSALMQDFANFRADIADGTLVSPFEIIEAVDALEGKIDDVVARLPPEYTFQTVSNIQGSAWIYGNAYYIHKTHLIAQVWSTIWMARLFLCDVLYSQATMIGNVQPSHSGIILNQAELLSRAEHTSTQIAEDLCAIAPQYLPCGPTAGSVQRSQTIAAGYCLIWPLFTAGSKALVPASVREYVIKVLNYIHDEMRIPQAGKSAKMLENNVTTEDFLHVFQVF